MTAGTALVECEPQQAAPRLGRPALPRICPRCREVLEPMTVWCRECRCLTVTTLTLDPPLTVAEAVRWCLVPPEGVEIEDWFETLGLTGRGGGARRRRGEGGAGSAAGEN